jgi:hypothetical protein
MLQTGLSWLSNTYATNTCSVACLLSWRENIQPPNLSFHQQHCLPWQFPKERPLTALIVDCEHIISLLHTRSVGIHCRGSPYMGPWMRNQKRWSAPWSIIQACTLPLASLEKNKSWDTVTARLGVSLLLHTLRC